ncbi:hypothetical protein D9M68_786090 [compost metagenome]
MRTGQRQSRASVQTNVVDQIERLDAGDLTARFRSQVNVPVQVAQRPWPLMRQGKQGLRTLAGLRGSAGKVSDCTANFCRVQRFVQIRNLHHRG